MAKFYTAKVVRMYVDETHLRIRLEGAGKGNFELPITKPNYNSLYSLALSAALNRLPLTVRVKRAHEDRPAVTEDPVDISYLTIQWE